MASNDEKISKFNLAINHYAEEQRAKIQQEVDEFKQRELEETEIEVLTEAYHLIQKEMTEMRSGITQEMAHRGMDARRELLAKRQKITDGVFERCSKYLQDYTQKSEYPALLEKFAKGLSSTFTKPGTVLCIKADDEKYKTQIEKAFGSSCTIQIDNQILLGGIRAFNPDMGIMADETLDTMLEDQREWFEENSGMAVV